MEGAKRKIYFAGLYNDDNLGDPVIARCTEELYKKYLPKGSYSIEHISVNHFCFYPTSKLTRKVWSICHLCHIQSSRLIDKLIKRDYIKFFDNKLYTLPQI